MHISIDTNEPLSALDREVLAILAGVETPATVQAPVITVQVPAVEDEPAPAVEDEPAPTTEDEPAPAKRKRRTKAEMEAARLAESDAAVRGDEADEPVDAEIVPDGPTLADALAAAQALLQAGKGAQVKAALDAAGAAKVSHLAPADIEGFLAAIADA